MVSTVFVARQPIFDVRKRLYGYELLYRRDSLVQHAGIGDAAGMTAQVLVTAMLHLGTDTVVGMTKAFVNMGHDQLVADVWQLLDKDTVIIEVPVGTPCGTDVHAACARMVAEGYTLALDDYEGRLDTAPLLDLASVVKVDTQGVSMNAVEQTVRSIPGTRIRLVAERVESSATAERCVDLGFDLFQGYLFSRPVTLSRRTVVPGAIAATRLLRLLADPRTEDRELERAIESDVGICYTLLRMVNSAAVGGRGIESIGHALHLVGRAPLRRWIGLMLVAGLGTGNDVRRELATAAMTRARMCELLSLASGDRCDSGNAFLAGLVSLLDTVLEIPAEHLARELGLAADITQAVTQRRGPVAAPLIASEALENGAWGNVAAAARTMGIAEDQVPGYYFDAVRWATETMAAA
jgi:EAL and modified HD-GYP domain-containing signal transduction protein